MADNEERKMTRLSLSIRTEDEDNEGREHKRVVRLFGFNINCFDNLTENRDMSSSSRSSYVGLNNCGGSISCYTTITDNNNVGISSSGSQTWAPEKEEIPAEPSNMNTNTNTYIHDNPQSLQEKSAVQHPESSKEADKNTTDHSNGNAGDAASGGSPKKQKKETKPSKAEIKKLEDYYKGKAEELPDNFVKKIQAMGCKDEPRLVTQKLAFFSDVDGKRQQRFKIDKDEIKKPKFFDEKEKKLMRDYGKIRVPLILQRPNNGDLETVELCLSKWTSSVGKTCHVLTSDWNMAREKIGLQEKDYVQLWSFRYGDEKRLGFAMRKLD